MKEQNIDGTDQVFQRRKGWWLRYAFFRRYAEKRRKIQPQKYNLPNPHPMTRVIAFLFTAIVITFIARLIYLVAPVWPEPVYYVSALSVSLIAIALPASTLQALSLIFQIPLGIVWLIEWTVSLVLIAGLCLIQILLPLMLWIALGGVFILSGDALLGNWGVAIGLIGFITILMALGKKTWQIIQNTVFSTWREGWDIVDTMKNWYLPFPDRLMLEIWRGAYIAGQLIGGDVNFS